MAKKPAKAKPTLNRENGAIVDGRRDDGTFAPGNKGGPGNPMAKRVNDLRVALLNAVTPDDLDEVIRALVNQAKDGDVPAARELLDRIFGKATQAVEVSGSEGAPLFKAFINVDQERV